VQKCVSYAPAAPVCGEMSSFYFPLFILSIMSISAPVMVLDFHVFSPFVLCDWVVFACRPLMFGGRDIEVVNAFLSCCVNKCVCMCMCECVCVCVCVCVCAFVVGSLCKWILWNEFYAATYTCIAIYFNVHAFLIVYVWYNSFLLVFSLSYILTCF